MRTENDLRIALQHQADQAPAVAPALIARALGDQPRRSPARDPLSIAVAVAIVAALIAVPLAIRQTVSNSTAPNPSPAASSGAPSNKKLTALSWVVLPGDNWTEREMYGYPNQENIYIALVPPPRGNGVVITDFPPGGFDTGQLANAKPVTVDGHRGYYGQITTMTGPKPTAGLRYHPVVGPHAALAWEIEPDQWVVLSEGYYGSQGTTESQLVSAATSLGLRARSTPARLPFKVGYLPGSGWQLHTFVLGNPKNTTEVGQISLTRGTTELKISLDMARFGLLGHQNGLLGHVDRFNAAILQQEVGTEKPVTAFDSTTLAKIIHSIVVASPSNQEGSSWLTVDQLLP
jgi:hypothetical protein